jgi:nicotinamidase-related amidase
MNDDLPIQSPELMSPGDTALVVVDVQGKLVSLIPGHQQIVFNIGRLLEAAHTLGLLRLATEQYPQGLGPTVAELAQRLGEIPDKQSFSCLGCQPFAQALADSGVAKVLLAGIEAHVCVQQTALDLLAAGYRVYLAVDATGSRHPVDYEIALRRMEASGAVLTTTEAAMFEWCRTSGRSEFKAISQLVRQQAP